MPILLCWLALLFSQAATLRFTPTEVVPGKDSYTISAPAFAGSRIDLRYQLNDGRPQLARDFCELDAEGQAAIEVPIDTQSGVVRVLGIRRSGTQEWVAVDASMKVLLPHPLPSILGHNPRAPGARLLGLGAILCVGIWLLARSGWIQTRIKARENFNASPSFLPCASTVGALIVVSFVFAVSVYRAKFQSVVCDEAFTWQSFVAAPLSRIFTEFSANNHLLNTLLARLSIRAFGLSELALRLPSLLGCLIYLAGTYLFCHVVLGKRPLLLLAVVLLALNPFILDFLSVARGYGMALGFLMWSLYFLFRLLPDGHPPSNAPRASLLVCASVALGLSVCANLTLAFACIPLAVTFGACVIVDSVVSGPAREAAKAAGRLAIYLLLPGALVASALLGSQLRHARHEDFYAGTDALHGTRSSLVASSFLHHWTDSDRERKRLVIPAVSCATHVLIPVITVLLCLCWLRVSYRWVRRRSLTRLSAPDRALLLVGGAFVGAVGLLIVAKRTFNIPYPEGRTGLYLVIFLTLGCVALAGRSASRLHRYILAWPLVLLLSLCGARFLQQFDVERYATWSYDAGTKRIVTVMMERRSVYRGRQVRLGASWQLQPSLCFYRELYHLGWLAPVTRTGPDGNFDAFTLIDEDKSLVEQRRLTVIYEDPISDAILAVPSVVPH